MDIRDLIIDGDINEATKKAKAIRNAPKPPEWEVALSDAVDLAIRRTTAKTSRLLVLLMTKGQFYIKDEKLNTVEQLDEDNLAKFLSGCGYIHVDGKVPWLTGSFDSSKRHAERFVRLINDDNFQWLARRGKRSVQYNGGTYNWPSTYDLRKQRKQLDSPLPKMLHKLFEEVIGEERLNALANGASAASATEHKVVNLLDNSRLDEVQYVNDKFGIDWTRNYIRAFLVAPFTGNTLPRLSSHDQLFELTNFKATRFYEYLFGESVRMGYGHTGAGYYWRTASLDDFLNQWSDTLRMESQTRGKVYDKYPDDLDSLHRKLSFKVALMKISIDEWSFNHHSESLAKHVKEDASYIIRPPYNKNDMLDEAAQQANCLASYVKKYASGETDIYFLRSAMEPEKSLVTVEVRDGKVRQAYAACNRRPGEDELKWLATWCEEQGFEMIDVNTQHPLVA